MRSSLSLLKWDWLRDTYSLHNAVLAVFAQMRLTMRYVQPSWCGHHCLWSNEIDYEIRTAFMMRSLLSLLKWDWLWCGPCCLCSNEIDYEIRTAFMMRSSLSLLKWDWLWVKYSHHDAVIAVFAQMRLTMRYVQPSWCGHRCLCVSSVVSPEIHRDWLWDTYSLHDAVLAVFAFLVLSVQRYPEIDYEIRTAFMMRSLLSLLKWDWLWHTYSRHDAVLAVFAQMRLTMRYVQPS